MELAGFHRQRVQGAEEQQILFARGVLEEQPCRFCAVATPTKTSTRCSGQSPSICLESPAMTSDLVFRIQKFLDTRPNVLSPQILNPKNPNPETLNPKHQRLRPYP